MDFKLARHCTLKIYDKRGYDGAKLFIQMLTDTELIDIATRKQLMEMIFLLKS